MWMELGCREWQRRSSVFRQNHVMGETCLIKGLKECAAAKKKPRS
jgi:hypothetical protein